MDSRVFSRLATVTATALLLAGCSDGDGGSGGAGGTGGDTGTSGGSGGGGAGGQSTTGGTGGSAQGAGTVIGFAWPAGGTTPDLVAIDSATGQLEKLVALPPQADLFDLGTGAFDPATGHLYQLVDDDPSDPDTLLDIDVVAGTIAASVPVDLGAFAHADVFAVGSPGKLLGIGSDASGASFDLVEIDVATGVVTSISPIPALDGKSFTLSSALDPATGHAYFVFDPDAPALLDLDTATGDTTSLPLVTGDLVPPIQGLSSRSSGGLVGVAGELLGAPPDQTYSPSFVALDPSTATLSALSPLPSEPPEEPLVGSAWFDAGEDRMWLIFGESPDLLLLDAATGAVVLDTPLDTSVYSSFVLAAVRE